MFHVTSILLKWAKEYCIINTLLSDLRKHIPWKSGQTNNHLFIISIIKVIGQISAFSLHIMQNIKIIIKFLNTAPFQTRIFFVLVASQLLWAHFLLLALRHRSPFGFEAQFLIMILPSPIRWIQFQSEVFGVSAVWMDGTAKMRNTAISLLHQQRIITSGTDEDDMEYRHLMFGIFCKWFPFLSRDIIRDALLCELEASSWQTAERIVYLRTFHQDAFEPCDLRRCIIISISNQAGSARLRLELSFRHFQKSQVFFKLKCF